MINEIHQGDCIEVMKTWPANFVDTIITDPPYGLDFMGKDWDGDVPGVHFWEEMLRVCKPGALILAFGGTRTWHHLATAIEKAGWEIRDCLMWLYGSGFPKSLDISKAIDKAKGAERDVTGIGNGVGKQNPAWNGTAAGRTENSLKSEYDITAPATDLAREWNGWGTALKPAWEPIIVAMKPLDGTFAENAEKWGVAGINVDGGRIEGGGQKGAGGRLAGATGAVSAFNAGNHNPVDDSKGRWPANLLLDEEAAAMLDGQSGELRSGTRTGTFANGTFSSGRVSGDLSGSIGGASRFFYVAKAARRERNEGCEELPLIEKSNGNKWTDQDYRVTRGERPPSAQSGPRQNHHPTVKPLDLMKYLCLLTKTPTGGIVLDPFAGSGSTLIAAERTGRPYIGIEMNPEYVAIANARLAAGEKQMEIAV